MKVKQLLNKARIRLGDPNKAKISDYSLLDALKSALSLIAIALDNTTSNLLITRADIPLVNMSGPLPDNFQSLVSVEDGWRHAPLNRQPVRGEYQLFGNQIYADAATINILYKCNLQIVTEADDVPLPDTFTELLIKYIKIMLTDEASSTDAELLAVISPEVYRLTAGRERTELRQKLFFKV